MTFRYIFSEAATGLRRNLSMAISLIVTIFVSLTLVGLGLLVNTQGQRAEQSLGSQLTIQVYLCNAGAAKSATCTGEDVTPEQRRAVADALTGNQEVRSIKYQSKQDAYNIFLDIYKSDKSDAAVFKTVGMKDLPESYVVTLKDPQKYKGVEDQVSGMPGVSNVKDLHDQLDALYKILDFLKFGSIGIALLLLLAAIFQVVNTIRLATMARRREISIMRLVGASSLYIALPFLMEILAAVVIGVLLAAGAVASFVQFVVYDKIRDHAPIMTWVDWNDFLHTFGIVAVLGVVLTMIPTLFVTRKQLKV